MRCLAIVIFAAPLVALAQWNTSAAPIAASDLYLIKGGASCNYPYPQSDSECSKCKPTGVALQYAKCGGEVDRKCDYFPCGSCYQPDCVNPPVLCDGNLNIFYDPDCGTYTGETGGACGRFYLNGQQAGNAGYVYCPGS